MITYHVHIYREMRLYFTGHSEDEMATLSAANTAAETIVKAARGQP